MERLMCNFHYLGYYCSPNLSIHQNSTQELTWNFLVTLKNGSLCDFFVMPLHGVAAANVEMQSELKQSLPISVRCK